MNNDDNDTRNVSLDLLMKQEGDVGKTMRRSPPFASKPSGPLALRLSEIRKHLSLPGPPKYVKYWSKVTKNSLKGHYFTYLWGPGRHLNILVRALILRELQTSMLLRAPGSNFLGSLLWFFG